MKAIAVVALLYVSLMPLEAFAVLTNFASYNDSSAPEYDLKQRRLERTETTNNDIGSFIFRLYKSLFSNIDGNHCTMYPSCSRYGRDSFIKHKLWGFFLTADRLVRCGHDLKYYDKFKVGDSKYNIDYVP